MVKKEEALEQQQLTGPYPLSKVILPLSVSQLLGSPGEENTVDCCMIHLEALEGYTSQGLSICWRSCLRNSVTISEWLWSQLVQTSTLSSASTATLIGVEYLRQLHVSGTEGDWLTPLTTWCTSVQHEFLTLMSFRKCLMQYWSYWIKRTQMETSCLSASHITRCHATVGELKQSRLCILLHC